MNESYPKSSTDFDQEFIIHLLNGVFEEDVLKKCYASANLKTVPQTLLKFVKFVYNERVGSDKIRQKKI